MLRNELGSAIHIKWRWSRTRLTELESYRVPVTIIQMCSILISTPLDSSNTFREVVDFLRYMTGFAINEMSSMSFGRLMLNAIYKIVGVPSDPPSIYKKREMGRRH